MKKMNLTRLKLTGLLALIISIGTTTSGHAQTLLLSLQASHYNATTGVWTDSSGNADNATAITTTGFGAPGLVTGATPNGSSAVSFGNDASGLPSGFTLATGVPAGAYTAFVVTEPSGSGSFFGGGGPGDNTNGSFQYRIYPSGGNAGKQDVVQQSQADPGTGSAVVSQTGFSILDVTAGSSAGVAYRLNGASDGTGSAVTFTNPIIDIGTNGERTVDEFFNGEIADIEIYSGILTSAQITAEEAALTAEYVTPAAATPEPSTWALLLGGIGSLIVLSRFRKFGQV
jgi:hypothetical protein